MSRLPAGRAVTRWMGLELTRFGGHLTLWDRGAWRSPHAEPEPTRLSGSEFRAGYDRAHDLVPHGLCMPAGGAAASATEG